MVSTVARCDTCPLRAACPCYVPDKPVCIVGANAALSLWTGVVALAAALFAVFA